jgi:hypothetical protein
MFNSVRNYLGEKLALLKEEWKRYQQHGLVHTEDLTASYDTDIQRLLHRVHHSLSHEDTLTQYQTLHDTIVHALSEKTEAEGFPGEFRIDLDLASVPDKRIPPSGIGIVPFRYKKMMTVTATEEVPETGFQIHPRIMRLLERKYPEYLPYVRRYCRPLGTTDATVSDFFKPQLPSDPIPEDRKTRILDHIIRRLDATPCQPIHFVDTQFDGRPLSTGTDYYERRSFELRTHALYSHPREYERKPTSKGYFVNAFFEYFRTIAHWIKQTGFPFILKSQPDPMSALRDFFLDRPTMLFTRNHISDRDGNLKQRPVYNVSRQFSIFESMLCFPLHVLARKASCCIMYGFETLRGANRCIDRIAQAYRSFFTIDWSGFDQRLPRVITDLFWSEFLERLIIISHGYAPTVGYPSYPDLTPDKMYERMSNILWFLHTWYNNMIFVTADGFGYFRTHAGVPSGLLNTQYLDSFGNLFLILDGLIEFGCSDTEIDDIFMLIMGDDNSCFLNWDLERVDNFIVFLESYALSRYGMVLSKSKSIITMMRNKIETLSYRCNFGRPTRPIGKLVAQLCYPERGPVPKYTSARAIGMAYAACAMDPVFHTFCRDVYYEFLDDAAHPTDPDLFTTVQSHLPGFLRIDETVRQVVDLESFPSIEKIYTLISSYQGPLPFTPKWNDAHFLKLPTDIPQDFETLATWRAKHSLPRRPIPVLFK